MHVADAKPASHYFVELERLLRAEWPQIRTVRGNGSTVPEPLVALTPDQTLAGGLSFLVAESPAGEGGALWINAVLVAPPFRRRGVAGMLIQAAQSVARHHGARHLYALTEIPDLYRKQGWSVFSHTDIDYVMTCAIIDATRTEPLHA